MADAEERLFRRVPKLDEDYSTWALLFEAHLISKELVQPIEEPPPPEREAAALERYNRKDRKALAEIILGVKAPHLPTLAEAKTTRQAWDALQEALQSNTSARKVQLTRELATLRMGEGEALMAYVGRAKTLRAELAGAGHPVGEDTAVTLVLADLPRVYETVTTVLLAAEVSLQWNQLLPALLPVEVEQKEAAQKGGGEPSTAYGAYNSAGSRGRGGPRGPVDPAAMQLVCWYCNKRGHCRHKCLKLTANKKRRGGTGGGRDRGPDNGPSGAVVFAVTVRNTHPPIAGQVAASSQSESRSRGQHTWIINSVASHQMTNKSSNLANYMPTGGFSVTLANGETAEAVVKGSLLLSPQTGVQVTLGEMLYVPSLADNFLSVRVVTRHGGEVKFIGDTCTVHSPTQLVLTGMSNPRNQYEVVMEAPTAAVAYGQASSEVARLWNRRFCHLSAANLRTVSTLVDGIAPLRTSDVQPTEGVLCHPCVVGRMHAEPSQSSDAHTSKLKLIHMDLVGPLPASLGRALHFVAILDDYSELAVASTLKAKSDAGTAVQAWIRQLELQAGARVSRVRCDRAGELGFTEMRAFYARRGIRLEATAAHTPQQNGKAERLKRTLMERVHSVLAEAWLGKKLWAEALMAVIFTRHRAPTSDGKATPYNRFDGKVPEVACLRVWGSVACALKPKEQQRKLQRKPMIGRVVGYAAGGHAYRVYNPASRKVVVRRDVVADEASVSGREKTRFPPAGWAPDSGSDSTPETDDHSHTTTEEPDSAPSQPDSPRSTTNEPEEVEQVPENSPSQPTRGDPKFSTFGGGRYPERLRRPKRFFDDEPGSASQTVMTALNCEALRTVPATVKEAMARPDAHLWREAMPDELRSLAENDAWELVDLPPGAKLTGSRWVFDLKRDAAGNVLRYKARFVVLGFTQKPGVDYDEIWAPTPSKATMRAVLAIASARDMELHCLDIKTAYLNALVDKDVYVEQPEGFAVGSKLMCHILRAVYGCKQASRPWGSHFAATLTKAGAVRAAADPCLFV